MIPTTLIKMENHSCILAIRTRKEKMAARKFIYLYKYTF